MDTRDSHTLSEAIRDPYRLAGHDQEHIQTNPLVKSKVLTVAEPQKLPLNGLEIVICRQVQENSNWLSLVEIPMCVS